MNDTRLGREMFYPDAIGGTGDYLPLAGGTLTGPLVVRGGAGDEWLGTTGTATRLWRDVTYGDPGGVGRFVSNANTNHVQYSYDGISWAGVTGGNASNGMVYGDNKFVTFLGATATYSLDGITWSTTPCLYGVWQDAAYGRPGSTGMFVAVGVPAYLGEVVQYSYDGLTWAAGAGAISESWAAVTYGNPGGTGMFVAIEQGAGGRGAYSMHSYDGINWIAGGNLYEGVYRDVAYGNGKFVAVCARSSIVEPTYINYSTDGINWYQSIDISSTALEAITYGDGKFVATAYASNPSIFTSTDGITWETMNGPLGPSAWLSVAYGAGKFVMMSLHDNKVQYSAGKVISLDDGDATAQAFQGSGANLTGVVRWMGVPGSAEAEGATGDMAYEPGYVYVCVAQNTWDRFPIATW